jgi:hypothetical protein
VASKTPSTGPSPSSWRSVRWHWACLRSHEIVAEPFLIVGILAGIKEIVVLSVEAATLLEKGPEFSRAIVEIGVLGGVVLVFALSAFVLRVRRRDGDGG